MNKDFEQSYRELAKNEVPDLWNRIEAGLTEKSAPTTDKTITYAAKTENTKANSIKEGNKIRFFVRRYSGILAAVICVAVMLPAVHYMIQSSQSKSMESAADTAEGAAAYEAATEECVPAEEEPAEEEAAEEEPAEEAIAAGTAYSDSGLNAVTAGSNEESETEAETEAEKESMLQGNEEDAAYEVADSLTKPLTDGMVLKEVSVYVKSVSKNEFPTEEEVRTGTLYTVEILEDASNVFAVGEEIVVRLPLTSSWLIEEKESYQIDLKYESEEEYPFVIVTGEER